MKDIEHVIVNPDNEGPQCCEESSLNIVVRMVPEG